MNGVHRKALIVDSDLSARQLISRQLEPAGFDVIEIGDDAKANALGCTVRFDVVVLSLALPGADGLTVCRALRTHGPNLDTPILVLIASGEEEDTVMALENGADDCMTKPFGVRELIARVHALVRRYSGGAMPSRNCTSLIRRGDVVVDVDRRTAIANGRTVELTRQEFDLLHLLVSRPGIVFSRDALLSKIWGGDTYVTRRTVDAVISRLRRKLEANRRAPELILTSWGVGYKCADAVPDRSFFLQSCNTSVTSVQSE